MFALMHEALEKAKLIKGETIFLTGEIRSGKSTTFDWICFPHYLVGGG
jgi:hypothetical protein